MKSILIMRAISYLLNEINPQTYLEFKKGFDLLARAIEIEEKDQYYTEQKRSATCH